MTAQYIYMFIYTTLRMELAAVIMILHRVWNHVDVRHTKVYIPCDVHDRALQHLHDQISHPYNADNSHYTRNGAQDEFTRKGVAPSTGAAFRDMVLLRQLRHCLESMSLKIVPMIAKTS